MRSIKRFTIVCSLIFSFSNFFSCSDENDLGLEIVNKEGKSFNITYDTTTFNVFFSNEVPEDSILFFSSNYSGTSSYFYLLNVGNYEDEKFGKIESEATLAFDRIDYNPDSIKSIVSAKFVIYIDTSSVYPREKITDIQVYEAKKRPRKYDTTKIKNYKRMEVGRKIAENNAFLPIYDQNYYNGVIYIPIDIYFLTLETVKEKIARKDVYNATSIKTKDSLYFINSINGYTFKTTTNRLFSLKYSDYTGYRSIRMEIKIKKINDCITTIYSYPRNFNNSDSINYKYCKDDAVFENVTHFNRKEEIINNEKKGENTESIYLQGLTNVHCKIRFDDSLTKLLNTKNLLINNCVLQIRAEKNESKYLRTPKLYIADLTNEISTSTSSISYDSCYRFDLTNLISNKKANINNFKLYASASNFNSLAYNARRIKLIQNQDTIPSKRSYKLRIIYSKYNK